jgi:hypothetical protein
MSENKIERFRFSYNYGEYDDAETFETSIEFKYCTDAHISDVLEKFGQFLRGCGFCFDGEIVNVDLDKYELVQIKPLTVTKGFEQGINITNNGNVYPPGQENRSPDRGPYSVYPNEGIDAWNRGQTAV